MSRWRRSWRRGFSLASLLVLLALLLVLIGLLLPAVQQIRNAAARTITRNNLKLIVLACHNCNDTYKRLPPMWQAGPTNPPTSPFAGKGTVHFYLLPFLEQDELYRAATGADNQPDPYAGQAYAKPVPPYESPLDDTHTKGTIEIGEGKATWGVGNFGANYLVFGDTFGGHKWNSGLTIAKIANSDGMSNTLFFATRYARCGYGGSAWAYPASEPQWMAMFAFRSKAPPQSQPTQEQCNPFLAQGYTPAGSQVAMGDGSTRDVSPSISPEIWWAVCTPTGGEELPADWNN
jgi:hypothetical protein